MTVLKRWNGTDWEYVAAPQGDPGANSALRGLIANRPADGAVPNGYTYYATDVEGGQEYEMVGGLWVERGPSVLGDPSTSRLLDYVQLSSSYNAGALTANLDIDIPGLNITVISGIKPIQFGFKADFQPLLGTAATGTVVRYQTKLFQSDGAGGWVLRDADAVAAVLNTGQTIYHKAFLEYTVTPPAAGTSYNFKVMFNSNTAGTQANFFGLNTLSSVCRLQAIEV